MYQFLFAPESVARERKFIQNNIIKVVKQKIKHIFEEIGEEEVHGYQHALDVYHHSKRALNRSDLKIKLSLHQQTSIYLASLMHDIDDDKLFKGHGDLPNARRILEEIQFPLADEVLEQIKLVSFSSNGISDVYISNGLSDNIYFHKNIRKNKKGTQYRVPKWKLIARDSDRLCALSKIGVSRCISYGCIVSRPLFSSSTPRLTDLKSIRILAIQAWLGYFFLGNSTIDYFIKALIPRCIMSSGLDYFEERAKEGEKAIVQIILLFGEYGFLTKEHILSVVEGDDEATNMIHKYL